MPPKEWKIEVRGHPGSSSEDVRREPDWGATRHDHYLGYRNLCGRRPGITNTGDDHECTEVDAAWLQFQRTKEAAKQGKLVNFQDAIKSQKDFHLRHPENRSLGWRYVLDYTESEIKDGQDWPINVKQREAQRKERQRQRKDVQEGTKQRDGSKSKSYEDQRGDATLKQSSDQQDGEDRRAQPQSGREEEENKPNPQEQSLLRSVQHEIEQFQNLEQNDGKSHSNVHNRTTISIDDADQFTPDNWVPRSSWLIRLTGKFPLNAEAPLTRIFESGFITPNEVHYVRSHGAVPRLLWEFHELEVECDEKSTKFSMNDIKRNFEAINIPVFFGCDNGRRKEMNLIRRTTGFNWGPGAVGCAYWKGPLLRDVLLAAGVSERMPDRDRKAYYVHLRGADNPSQAKYETSVSFQYVMDATNDVLLAYEMNDAPIPPDHGYPIRVVIPGYVGGRNVKWLEKIWISDKENDSYYHIWDNRVVPGFVSSTDSDIAAAFFHHPDTAAYEHHINSVIAIPSQGERVRLNEVKDKEYRIRGIAYNGGGDKVNGVEVSLNEGETWLYCCRTYPDAPLRHDTKFWTWCFWHLDVKLSDLIRAPAITVRAFDVKKMCQPEKMHWNILGTMNNSQYTVKPEMMSDDGFPYILFRHPTEPANGAGGWMKNSKENEVADAERKTEAPPKQFTRAEIEKHDSKKDCWIVVDNKVYDATSVLPWHPGGAAAIMPHAGRVHAQTTEEFSSIHDDYAYSKLNECVLGTVTEKAKKYIAQTEKAQGKEDVPRDQALRKHRWTPAKLIERTSISEDVSVYKFALSDNEPYLGLGTCQHIEFGFHMRDKMLIRPYTPTKPVLPRGSESEALDTQLRDGCGTFELTVKTYFTDEEQPGGALSNILYSMPLGEEVEMRGPNGDIVYQGHGKFTIYGEEKTFRRISLVLGGTGLTPGFSLIARICLTPDDETEVRVIDANKGEADILLKEDLDRFEEMSMGQVKFTHVLSHPSNHWHGLKGHVDKDIMHEHLFEPAHESVVLLCGPPAMIQKAVLPVLEAWGYEHDQNMFGL